MKKNVFIKICYITCFCHRYRSSILIAVGRNNGDPTLRNDNVSGSDDDGDNDDDDSDNNDDELDFDPGGLNPFAADNVVDDNGADG